VNYKEGNFECLSTLPFTNDAIIIALQSTIFATPPQDSNALYNKCEGVKDLLNEKLKGFDDIEKATEGFISELVNNFIKLCKKDNEEIKVSVDVISIPPIGKLGRYSFNVSPDKVKGLLLLKLYNKLNKLEKHEIYLDITHGVNYITAITFDAMQWISALLGKRLHVINAVQTGDKEFEIQEISKFVGGGHRHQHRREQNFKRYRKIHCKQHKEQRIITSFLCVWKIQQ